MATVFGLRRRIRRLNAELEELTREQERLRAALQNDGDERVQRMQRELNELIEEDRRLMDRVCTDRIRQVRQQLTEQMETQMEQFRRATEEGASARQALVKQLEETNCELQQELRSMSQREETRVASSRARLDEYRRDAEALLTALKLLPCDFFCPGHLDILREQLSSARAMENSGLYEAAASTTAAARVSLEMLQINVSQALAEWEDVFCVFRQLALEMHRKVVTFEKEEVDTPLGVFSPMAEEELAYWSCRQYKAARDEVEKAYKIVQDVDAAGAAIYLRTVDTAPKGFALTQQVKALYRLSERLNALTTCIRSERYYSDARFMLAEAAAAMFVQKGYMLISTSYRGDPEEPLDCLDLVTSPDGQNVKIKVVFAPVREDGVAVDTVALLAMEATTLSDVSITRRLTQTAKELNTALPGLKVICGAARTDLAAKEKEYKKTADVRLLLKKMEKRIPGQVPHTKQKGDLDYER